MGGLSKHMMHPSDNLDLTKDKLMELMARTMSNRFPLKEKVDGLNIHFLNVNGELRMARNNNDLMVGGFGIDDIPSRFDNEQVQNIYLTCYAAALKANILELIPLWYDTFVTLNAECVSGTTNIITYKGRKVVLHNYWFWDERDGKFEVSHISDGINKEGLDGTDVCTDPLITITLDGTLLDWQTIGNRISEIFDGTTTIRQHYQKRFLAWLYEHGMLNTLPNEVIRELFNRFFESPTMNLRELRKMSTVDLDPILNDKQVIVAWCKKPLEKMVLDFGQILLQNCKGYMNEKYTKATDYMYLQLAKAIKTMPVYMMNAQFDRMSNMRPNPLEGIVVEMDGQLYKWTGSFAPINQIVGRLIRS